ncbi:MAG: hypothetical protein Tp1111DCM1126091_68 [Prokaryotic dsDNA virus sp.]|nr:MAG: hypothetical protein Tp1111DCM1126091_68 [Prokaryotic dsDNA virus sp.]|tara:strand:+ start:70072 stop:70428 length:357 start_codon:yes stop_codon:yes gene_type:complete
MNNSKTFLLSSLALIIGAILLIIIGGSVAFTLACLAFIGSGVLYSKFQYALDFEDFERKVMSGQIDTEEAGDMPEAIIDLEELSESDKEVVQRLFGIDFATGEDYTEISEIKREETKE